MTTPSTVNPAAAIANQILHDLVYDVAVKAAEAAIIAALPFAANPIMQKIDHAVVEFIAGKIFEVLSQGVTFAIIDAQTNAEAHAANAAATDLKTAISKGDHDAIKSAEAAFSKAFARLVHMDGSAVPHP